MKSLHLSTRIITVLLFTSTFFCLYSQEEQVEKMLDIARVTSDDFVIDLGSGDGRLVITAAMRGAKARGIEYNENMVEFSRKDAIDKGVGDRTEFIQGDLFEADLSEATVITMYLLPRLNLRLRPSLLELKPGTRIVSNSHSMADWIPDELVTDIKAGDLLWRIYFWIIPAKAEGTWKIPKGELKLTQEFQMLSGTLRTGRKTMTISEGRLLGNEITFITNDEKYSGRVNGDRMEGIVTSTQKTRKWNASRKGN
jgi:hypothetical protein